MISCNTHFFQRYNKTSFNSRTLRLRLRIRRLRAELFKFLLLSRQYALTLAHLLALLSFWKDQSNFSLIIVVEWRTLQTSVKQKKWLLDVVIFGSMILVSSDWHSLRMRRLKIILHYKTMKRLLMHYFSSNNCFKARKAFSNTKKIKLYFNCPINIEIDLAFYQKLEVCDLSGGNFQYDGPSPSKGRRLSLSRLGRRVYVSRLRKVNFPIGPYPPTLSFLWVSR